MGTMTLLPIPFIVREARRTVSKELAIRNIFRMAAETGLEALPHALRRSRDGLVRGHDDGPVSLLVRAVVLLYCASARGVFARV